MSESNETIPIKRLYILTGSTENLGQTNTDITGEVLVEVPRDVYRNMAITINGIAKVRNVGNVNHQCTFYNFRGSTVFLENGIAQPGIAITTDKNDEFSMVRLFANSDVQMTALEEECGYYQPLAVEVNK